MINRFHFLSVLALSLGAVSAQAGLLNSFETGIDGVSASAAVTLASSTLHATDGTNSLAVTYTGFNWIQLGGTNAQMSAYADAITNSTTKKISLDVSTDASLGAWANMVVAFNDTSGWRQTATGVAYPNAPGTQTIVLDVSGLAAPNYAGGNWFQIQLGVNSAAGGTVYIDNVRTVEAVPEPATMAALGLGVVAFARKRRR